MANFGVLFLKRSRSMAREYTKLWLQATLTRIARHRAEERIHRLGRNLPCKVKSIDGAIVTVSFKGTVNNAPFTLPDITIPKAESPWIRSPTQVGDVGLTMAADAYIGALALMGSGVANLTQPFSLSDLVFVPLGMAQDPMPDPNAALVQGPNGVILNTTKNPPSKVIVNGQEILIDYQGNTIAFDKNGITLTGGGSTIRIDSSGVTIDGILFDKHIHGSVQPGSGFSSGPQS